MGTLQSVAVSFCPNNHDNANYKPTWILIILRATLILKHFVFCEACKFLKDVYKIHELLVKKHLEGSCIGMNTDL